MAGYYLTNKLLPIAMEYNQRAGLFGHDFHKPASNKPKVPEAGGLVPATIYLCLVIVMLFLTPSPRL